MAKILVFPDGSEIPVVEDGGRYWITANARYSKANTDIRVKRVSDEEMKKQKEADAIKKNRSPKTEDDKAE